MLIHVVPFISLTETPPVIGSFYLGADQGSAFYSKDREAIFVPRLKLLDMTVRRIVNGEPLFRVLRRVHLIEPPNPRNVPFDPNRWSFVWGEFTLYTNAQPSMAHAILLRSDRCDNGIDLDMVGRYVRERARGRESTVKASYQNVKE